MPHIVIQDVGEPSTHDLSRDETVIGRDPDCHIQIDSNAVSRTHARIVRDGDRFLVEDIGSRNGTLVNGMRIVKATPLVHNDSIRLGPILIRFVGQAATAEIREARQERIREMGRAMAGTLDLDTLLSKTLETLLAIFRIADRGCILLKARSAGPMVPRAVIHRYPGEDASVKISDTILSQVLSEKRGILSADADSAGKIESSASLACRTIGPIMCVPLLGLDGDAKGAIYIDSQDRLERFQMEDLDLMTAVARQAAISFENAWLVETPPAQDLCEKASAAAPDPAAKSVVDENQAAPRPSRGRLDRAGLPQAERREPDGIFEQSGDMAELVESCNRFAFDLHASLAGQPGNLFFSPSSIALALAMTLTGAAEETGEEIARVLHATLPDDRFHEALRELQNSMNAGRDGLKLANRLWGQAGGRFLSEFLQATERCYGARLAEVNFKTAAEEARLQINEWVADQTAGKIENLIPAGGLHPLTRLVVTNAIYFKGSWHQEFDEHNTEQRPFWTEPGLSQSVSMMRQTANFLYGEFDGLQVLELPYRSCLVKWRSTKHGDVLHLEPVEMEGSGSNLVMNILLPSRIDGLRQIEDRLTTESLEKLTTLETCLVEVSIPKFRIESAFLLNEVLASLGMRQAFSVEAANFSRMSDDPEGLFLAALFHKAYVDVNEKGTEAAAATGIAMGAAGVMEEPELPKIFLADHPFLFLIRDRQTRLIHFVGRAVNLAPVQ